MSQFLSKCARGQADPVTEVGPHTLRGETDTHSLLRVPHTIPEQGIPITFSQYDDETVEAECQTH